MLLLNDPRWAALSDAYGGASGVSKLLAEAEALPPDSGSNAEPYFTLWSALCHQGDVYSASYAALPHLVRIVEANPEKFRWTLLALVQAIETARLEGRGPPIPNDLRDAYIKALERLPSVAAILMRANVSELELRVILSACASAKGFASLGEAITELTPENTTRFLEDWRFQ
jgi:hypothetical protein